MFNLQNLQQVTSLYQERFIQDTLEFSKRLVVYSHDSREESIKLNLLATGVDVSEDPESIPYHLNLQGKLSVLDTPIYVKSLDDGTEIQFDKETLMSHPYTRERYQQDSTLRTQLISANFSNLTLINGTLSDIEYSDIREANHCQILYHSAYHLGCNENYLVGVLQEHIYNFRDRWYNVTYPLIDELYSGAFVASLYAMIPSFIFSIRESVIGMYKANNHFKMLELASYGISPHEVNSLTNIQVDYLYHNLPWLQKNSGSEKVLKSLVNNLGNENIKLKAFEAFIVHKEDALVLPNIVTPDTIEREIGFREIDIVTEERGDTLTPDDYYDIENLLLSNDEISNRRRERNVFKLENSRGRTSLLSLSTKTIGEEATVNRFAESLNLFMAIAGDKFTTEIEFNGITHPASVWRTVLILALSSRVKKLGLTIPATIQVKGHYNGVLPSGLDAYNWCTEVRNALSEISIPTYGNIAGLDKFRHVVGEVWSFKEEFLRIRNAENIGEHELLKNMFFKDLTVTIDGGGTSTLTWLLSKGIILDDIQTEDYLLSLIKKLLVNPVLTLNDSVITKIIKKFISYERDIVTTSTTGQYPMTAVEEHPYTEIYSDPLTLVPVELFDNYQLLGTSGVMDISFIDIRPNTVVSWELIEGTIDTVSVDVDTSSLTFTSDNSDYKLFRIYTNADTEFEQSDIGRYYHHPIDTHDASTIAEAERATMVSKHHPDFNVVVGDIWGGMYPTDSRLVGYDQIDTSVGSIIGVNDVDGQYVELTVNTDFVDDNGLIIRSIEVHNDQTGNWALERVLDPTVKTVLNFGTSAFNRKLVLHMYRDGYEWFIEVDFTGGVKPGISDTYDPEDLVNRDAGVVSNINTILSHIVILSEADYYTFSNGLRGLVSNNYTLLQRLNEYGTITEQYDVPTGDKSLITNIETSLSTIISIT